MNVTAIGSRASVSPLTRRSAANSGGLSSSTSRAADALADATSTSATLSKATDQAADERTLRKTFDSALGQTLFGQMLKSMRKTQGKPAYFHGGRAEEVFQQQLDQVLAEKMSQASASSFTGPMFDLFMLQRQ